MSKPHPSKVLRTVGLFAGIAGIERGLAAHGHHTNLMSESDVAARQVLQSQFNDCPIGHDVRKLKRLPSCDLVVAGFPCQDLSQCGKTAGIDGLNSSLVGEVFRLLETRRRPAWVVLENVPFMLRLDGGRAMSLVSGELTRLGYRWAYRTVDVRAFGLPQRRLRVIIVASHAEDPRRVLFADDQPEPPQPQTANAYGFYWTEGLTGVGWGVNCVPTLKGGSGLGIPSPPAVWVPHERRIGTIHIADAERLQGFPVGWTEPAAQVDSKAGTRWRLVGNAVCVPVAAWLGRRLSAPGPCRCETAERVPAGGPWPQAAYGDVDGTFTVHASTWPMAKKRPNLLNFLKHPLRPLSHRATAGFLSRATRSRLRFAPGFLADVKHHLKNSSTRNRW